MIIKIKICFNLMSFMYFVICLSIKKFGCSIFLFFVWLVFFVIIKIKICFNLMSFRILFFMSLYCAVSLSSREFLSW